MLDSKNGKVMTLISQTQTEPTKFIVNQSTLQHICSHQGQYCFISICGDYRSGKSFLLNSLFFNYSGFQTSATTQSCTKGIKIWSEPILHQDLNIWIVDTEGFGSIEKDSTYDGKIFLMNLLLSNIILYNSFGAIDENSLNKLAMICRQAKSMDSSTGQTKLFWILRDFSLEMINREGKQLTSNQYMEECLRQNQHNHNKKQKQFLKNLFKHRYCVPLIRPVIDQQKLGNLKALSKTYLREQFKLQIQNLYKMIEATVSCKQINAVNITHQNISIFINEFVNAVNSQVMDCNLSCTYDKIVEFQLSQHKQTIKQNITERVNGMSKLIPVQHNHLVYLRQQIKEIIAESVKEFNYCNEKDRQFLSLEIWNQIQDSLQQLEHNNQEKLQQDIREYLYRNLIQLYPKFITLNMHNFEPKLTELITKFKQQYRLKYTPYFSNERTIDSNYCNFMQKQEKKLIFQIVKRWKAAQKEWEDKGEEIKKHRKNFEEETRKLKEEKLKLIKTLEDSKREENRSILKLREDAESSFREEATAIAKNYQSKIRELTTTYEQKLRELRSKLQQLQDQNSNLSNQLQIEKQSLLQKLALQKEKSEIINLKLQQTKNNFEMQQQQTKNSYENKIRITEMKCNELQNYLNNERKKFTILADSRKAEQAEMLEDIAQKNEKILDLNEQLVHLEEKYRVQLEKILLEEKEILCKTINSKISQTQHKCRLYEGKLQEYALLAEERHHFERKSEQLEIQLRELRTIIEQQNDKIELLNSKNKKYEKDLEDKDQTAELLKNNYQKEINLINQTLSNNTKFIKEAEDRHHEEVEYLKNKIETELREQSSVYTQRHEEALKQNRLQLQQKFEKERTQLKDIIKNNYDEIQNLKINRITLTNQLERMHLILTRIRNKNHNLGQSPQKESTDRSIQESQINSYNLIDIAQSPEEQCEKISASSKKENIQQIEFLAEEIEEIYESMRREIRMMNHQRISIKNEMKSNIDELESYEAVISKVKTENKLLKTECDQIRKRIEQLQPLQDQCRNLKQNLQNNEKQLSQAKREIDLKQQLHSKRQETVKENVRMYKQAINNLTDQNKRLHYEINDLLQKNHNLQSELQRFKIWAVQVKTKTVDVPTSCQNLEDTDTSVSKIRQLQAQIKRLAKKLQQQKISKMEKSPIKENNLLSDVINEQRINQIETLRNENQLLYKKLEDIHQQQLRNIEQKKSSKNKQTQIEEHRISTLKEELQSLKKRSKDTITQLEAELATHIDQKNQLKKQFLDLENNILKKYELNQKIMQQQINNLKKEKISNAQSFNRKIAALQQSLNTRSLEADRRLAQAEHKFAQFQQELEKEQNRVILQGERHRLKYEHLLKVNGQLIREIQTLKSKAHQITLKQKYKSKISNLFND